MGARAITVDGATAGAAGLALGVIVPCRDEAAVIARKLSNLAACAWPAAAGHRVVVVDDHSRDATAALARAQGARLAERGVGLEVAPSERRPGKPGAIAAGLARLRGQVDLIVLSDADVVLEPDALCALERAFAADPGLHLACGAQRFVRDLAGDGSARASDGAAVRSAAGLYDRVTAFVRGLESRAGRLFSVHGELMAWRAELELEPTPGFAADDLDLMLQARLRGGRVRLVSAARFLESKTPDGQAREAQALRRARAYVQFLRHPSLADAAARGALAGRAQVWAYRRLPTAAPLWVPVALALAGLAGWLVLRAPWSYAFAAGLLALCASPVGLRLFRLLAVIRQASACERAATLADRWETPRA